MQGGNGFKLFDVQEIAGATRSSFERDEIGLRHESERRAGFHPAQERVRESLLEVGVHRVVSLASSKAPPADHVPGGLAQ